MRFSGRTWFALFLALVIVVIAAFLWLMSSHTRYQFVTATSTTSHTDSTVTPIPVSNNLSSRGDSIQTDSTAKRDPEPVVMGPTTPHISTDLIIPVAGVTAAQLTDTYTQARSNGRTHDAIDIMVPHNSPVIAAASGTIARLFQSVRGGTTIYELSPDGHTVYYYAHLDRYADGLTQGDPVEQGQLLGYVGDTGDAGPGNYHLHFAIWLIQDPKKFWDGENINPYPILRQVK